MTQYHYLDESGDPGLKGQAGSSSHFALAMVQLPERGPLSELALVRTMFHLPPIFEFKYYKAKPRQKLAFFESVRKVPLRVRAVVIDKASLPRDFAVMSGQEFMIEFIAHLALRAPEVDIANDVLVVDGATRAFLRGLRVRLSRGSRDLGRVRPFKTIVGRDSRREDGLQLADMMAGAIRQYVAGVETGYYGMFADKVVDLWRVPETGQ